ncbi:MAG: helix-turn-helix transcriptional regulator [Planctomycetes bacterium]|nr:helix-turn-helix transcriptional regulator [Planctomycetota bacterium]
MKNINDNNSWLKALSSEKTTLISHTNTLHTSRPYFGFDKRITNQHILNYTVAGGYIAGFDNTEYHLRPGSLIWLRPNTPHSFRYFPGERFLRMINFRFSLCSGEKFFGFAKSAHVVENAGHLLHYSQTMLNDALCKHSLREERCKRLLYLLFTEITEEDEVVAGRVLSAGERGKLIAYIHEHIKRRPSPNDLARVLNFSPDYFRRIFHRTFKCSPRHWLLEQRIHQAAALILSGATVSEAAQELGYSDIYLFSRQFKAAKGIAPSRYAFRKSH